MTLIGIGYYSVHFQKNAHDFRPFVYFLNQIEHAELPKFSQKAKLFKKSISTLGTSQCHIGSEGLSPDSFTDRYWHHKNIGKLKLDLNKP